MTFFSSPRLKGESHKDLSQSPYRIVESKPDDQLLLQAERRCKLNMTMGQIIYCSDLVLRIDEHEEVHNITEWLYESTDYRPINPDGCVIRHEMTTMVNDSIDFWEVHSNYIITGEIIGDFGRLDCTHCPHHILLLLLRTKALSIQKAARISGWTKFFF